MTINVSARTTTYNHLLALIACLSALQELSCSTFLFPIIAEAPKKTHTHTHDPNNYTHDYPKQTHTRTRTPT
jgi:hypothetical protein